MIAVRRAARGALTALLLILAIAVPTGIAWAHDPSAWGGIYRSRNGGETWLLGNEGRFVTAALDLAINPADPDLLLLATDSGLLRSPNRGRDWEVDGVGVLDGAVFAVTFDATGRRSLASTGRELFVRDEAGASAGDAAWRPIAAPTGAAPVRDIVPAGGDRVYLVGWSGIFRSDDWGASWAVADGGLPDGAVTAFVVDGPNEVVLAVVAGDLWTSVDGGDSWQPRGNGLPVGRVDTVALDPSRPDRLWAAGADRLFRSDDRGVTWRAVGNPLSEPETTVRGIGATVGGATIVLTTDRGLFRSRDGGQSWEMLADNLPAHLESRPLVRDPQDPATLYAGFSVVPYESIWQSAADGRSLLARLDWVNLAGGAAFIILLLLAAGLALRWLGRYYGASGVEQSVLGTVGDPRTAESGQARLAERVT